MNKVPQVIGRKVHIDLPSYGIFGVLAKIDTGADNSSIWASDIHEIDGELRFTLFDKSSHHYTGEVITVRDFTMISVRNSFGHAETRYRVALMTTILEKRIRVNFTLANRSRNTSPILIGRKTLSGKFLVDVKKKARVHPQRVLILSQRHSDEVKKFTLDVEARLKDTYIDYGTYDDIVVSFRAGRMEVRTTPFDKDLADYDIVHFKTSVRRDVTASLARYAVSRGVTVPDADAIMYFPTMSKLYEYTLLTLGGVMIPDTVFASPQRMTQEFAVLARELGVPFVMKDIHGSKGNFNEVIADEAAYRKMTQRALGADIYLVAQRFTPNDGDYRILVMGQRIQLIIYRQRLDNTTHLNNTTQGGRATLVALGKLPPQVRQRSLEAAKIMSRDIAGVDMVQDKVSGLWYCFEVNDGPQIVTGAFPEEKRAAFTDYMKRILEKRV